jgi:FkbM family methyltransferase
LRFITRHPVNEKHQARALFDFVRWQVKSRLVGGEFTVDWIEGAKFKASRGRAGVTGNIYAGLHEFPDMGFLLHYLRPDDAFADVGANVGSYTILGGAVVGARCFAFEPVPQTFARLVENVRLNGRQDVDRCFNLGVGDTEGTIRFTSGDDTVNHVAAEGEAVGETVEVRVSTLDAVLAGVRPRLLKVDVEGYEEPVVRGAVQTLSGTEPAAAIMELNGACGRYGYSDERVVEQMLDWGFRTYRYHPFERQLVEVPVSERINAHGNTLFVRGEAFARERVATARKFRVRSRWV